MDKKATSSSLAKVDHRILFDGMKCRGCFRFPSPYHRFICGNGHLVCKHCVDEQYEKTGIVCWMNLADEKKEDTVGAGGSENGATSKLAATSVICQRPLHRVPADPVYCAFFNAAKWNCPGSVHPDGEGHNANGCKEVMKGGDVFGHLEIEHCQQDQSNNKIKRDESWDYE